MNGRRWVIGIGFAIVVGGAHYALLSYAQAPPAPLSCEDKLDGKTWSEAQANAELAQTRMQLRQTIKERDEARATIAGSKEKTEPPKK